MEHMKETVLKRYRKRYSSSYGNLGEFRTMRDEKRRETDRRRDKVKK